jgi:transposase-like protein
MTSLGLPRTILELGRVFSSEEKCREYLMAMRWPGGFVCPHCGGGGCSTIRSRPKQLKCNACNRQVSITAGTVMEKSKTPLCSWFAGAYMMSTLTPGISAVQFGRQVGISTYECAFQVLHKLRAAAGLREKESLRGTVEVDETYVGAERKGKRGRGAKGKALVVGAVEVSGTAAGRCRLRVVPNVRRKTLHKFLRDHVARGSVVKTDGLSSYEKMERYGYVHDVTVESTSEEDAKEWLPHVHRVFGNLKTWLNGTHHGVSPKHMQAYLNEFGFRFSRRRDPKKAFEVLLGLAAEHEGPTYERLYRAGLKGGWRHPNPLWGKGA